MKKISIVFIILILTISMFTSVIATETASNIQFNITSSANIEDSVSTDLNTGMSTTSDEIEIPEELDNVFYDDIYKIEEEVNINKDVYGNVYIIAKKINIESISIEGNVFLIANEINIKNTSISGSAYIIGENISLNSLIQDLYIIGSQVTLGNSSYITRTARIAGKSVNISGIIEKNCYIDAENIKVNKDTIINGVLSCSSTEEASIDSDAIISKVEAEIKEKIEKEENYNAKVNINIYRIVSSVVQAFIIMGLIILISRRNNKINEKITVGSFLTTTVKGMAALIGIPVAIVLLICTLLGAGIGIVLLLIYTIILYISTSVTSLRIGANIVKEGSRWKLLGVGTLVYAIYKLISMVPVFGWLLSFVMCVAGIGYVIEMIFAKESKEEIIVENK